MNLSEQLVVFALPKSSGGSHEEIEEESYYREESDQCDAKNHHEEGFRAQKNIPRGVEDEKDQKCGKEQHSTLHSPKHRICGKKKQPRLKELLKDAHAG